MKKIIIFAALVVITTLSSLNARPRMNVDFNYFYHSLAPHGEWISLDGDLLVWRPTSVHYDWQPYSIGQWSWTQNGWYWDSYEPFGWATYHYGRWMYEDYYGWVWLPDYEWAPAWVEWRYDNDYIGWSPLPAYASFNIGVGIHFSMSWRSRSNFWNFVSYNHFCDRNIHHHFMDHRHVNNFFERTKYRTNYYIDNDRIFNGGIDRNYVERRGGYRVAERQINRTNSMEDYNRGRENNDNGIRSYVPSGKELNRYKSNSERTITRGTRSTTLQKDKIVVGSRSDDKNLRDDNRVERGSREKQPERSRDLMNNTEKRNNVRENDSKGENSKTSVKKRVIKRESTSVRSDTDRMRPDNNSSTSRGTISKSTRIQRQKNEVKRESTPQADKRIEKRKSSNNDRGTKSQSKRQTTSSNKKVQRKVRR